MGLSHFFTSALMASVLISSVVSTDLPGLPNLLGGLPSLPSVGVSCIGVSSLMSGTCRKDAGECTTAGGTLDGSCVGGLGQCCVQPLKCGGQSLTNGSFLGNSKYPSPDTASNECTITIDKTQLDIKQIRLELIKFDVGTPDAEGKCSNDFMSIQSGLAPGASIPRLCGKNNGQHIILPVSQNLKDQTVVIRFSISGSSKSTWLIQAIQLKAQDALIAPDNCLQYFTGPSGHIKSLSKGANLDKLRYSICFRQEVDFCSIKFDYNASNTVENSTAGGNSTETAESRKRREAHGYYASGNYVHPIASAPQQPGPYVRPVEYLAKPAPVQYQQQHPGQYPTAYKQPAQYPAHPAYPAPGPYPAYPAYGAPTTAAPGVMTTTATGTSDNGTVTEVPDNTGTSPSTPTANCDGQDIVTFPPATIVCASNQATTTPIILDHLRLIVFVDNRGTPPHATGWKYSYQYESCRN